MDERETLNRFYLVRWYDSCYYTSVNHVDYVLNLFNRKRPEFYKFLVYELVETELSFKALTVKLPFDKDFKRVSVNNLHELEKAKLKYHLKKLKESNLPSDT